MTSLDEELSKVSLEEEEKCEEVDVSELSDQELVEYARYGEIEILYELVRLKLEKRLSCQDSKGNSMLHMYSANGHISCIKYLLSHIESTATFIIDRQNLEGNTALHWASSVGQLESVQLLVEAGASISIENKATRTPICEAHRNQRDLVLQYYEKTFDPKS
jgi:ankyrin repeat protein